MFENLNKPGEGSNNLNSNNAQTPSNQPEVDDIFADTDSAPANNSESSILDEDDGDEKKGGKTFTIIVVVMVVIIIGLLGFLLYNKFLKGDKAPDLVVDNNVATGTDSVIGDENSNENTNGEADQNSEFNDFIPLAPGEEESATGTDMTGGEVIVEEDADIIPTAPVDSDTDGLSDSEELIYGTNPLLMDTDGDGVSDYEEIKIYNSNPLNTDSDGDGFSDGEEIDNGYNPNGTGMLSDK